VTITTDEPAPLSGPPASVDRPTTTAGTHRATGGAVWALALASAAGAVAARLHPTANAVSDVIVAVALGALVVVAASTAGPRAWAVAAAIAFAGSAGAWMVVAAGGLALAAVGLRRAPGGNPALGAAVGAIVAQVVLRLPPGRFGANLVVSTLAVACLVLPAWAHAGDLARDRLRRGARVAGAVAALIVVALGVSVLLARRDVETGIGRAQAGLSAARRGDGDRAADLLDEAGAAFESAHTTLDAWWARPARVLPVVGQHARSLEILAAAGADLADAASTSARSARVQDLRVRGGRLDLDRVRSMAAPLAAVQTALSRARDAVPEAESEWLLPPVASRLAEFERSVDDAAEEAATASDAVAVLPGLLGGEGTRSYFVAFGTPAETRELGGFMGAYAILTAEDGDLTLAGTGRVRDLNELLRGKQLTDPSVFPPDYLAMLPQRFWHNITATPDFPTVAEAVHQLWPARAFGAIDGVLYMDPATLADLIELTGPIRVEGYEEPLTADNAADFLLREQYIAFPGDDRHDFLVDAATTVFRKLTSGDLPRPAVIADTLAPAARQRRLLLHSFHPDEQALFEQLDLDGALPAVDGDFLSVRASNRGLNKVDSMVRRTIAYDVVADPIHGRVHSTVTVTIRNDSPSDGLPYDVIGNRLGAPDGTSSTTLAVYSPLAVVDVRQDGRSVPRGASPSHDRNRYTALVEVPPGGEVTVVFELEGSMDLTHGYHLEVVPQPMVNPDELRIDVEGSLPWVPWGDHTWAGTLLEPVELRVPLRLAL